MNGLKKLILLFLVPALSLYFFACRQVGTNNKTENSVIQHSTENGNNNSGAVSPGNDNEKPDNETGTYPAPNNGEGTEPSENNDDQGNVSTPETSIATFVNITLDKVDGVFITPPSKGIVGIPVPKSSDGSGINAGVLKDGRTIKLTPYAIAKTELTYELWNDVRVWAEKKGYTFTNNGLEGSGNLSPANMVKGTTENSKHPVTEVNWYDSIVWCNAYTEMINKGDDSNCVYRLSNEHNTVVKDANSTDVLDSVYADMSKKGFRLPTEAEWEYAARLESDRKTLTPANYVSGAKNDIDEEGRKFAWYKDYSKNENLHTIAVATLKSNDIGLYDMSGNVDEWCFDRYNKSCDISDEHYKVSGIVTDPLGEFVRSGGLGRVQRGGNWYYGKSDAMVGERNGTKPINKSNNVGFRLAWRPAEGK